MYNLPKRVLPMRKRAEIIDLALKKRLDTIVPAAMRHAGIDMWLVLCQEDDLDPVFRTLIPMNCWCPILQMLIFYDRGEAGIERINLSMTNTGTLYDRPWSGRGEQEQWTLLHDLVVERNPQHIGINIGSVQWAAGGLTYNLYQQLVSALPAGYADRLVSAEKLVEYYGSVLNPVELGLYDHVGAIAHDLIESSYSPMNLWPGITTTTDLEWNYWQMAADCGLDVAFKPYFNLVRGPENATQFGTEDTTIRPGDLVHSDVGVRYLRLISDHQQWAYIPRPNESEPPEGIKNLMVQAGRLQDVYMASFETGLTGDELLARILTRAHEQNIPNPKVYSHSLGLYLHEPGPLIGLPWEQESCVGRGAVPLREGNCFTMELSITEAVPEWDNQPVTFSIEEDVAFVDGTCRLIDGRQTEFYLV